MLFSFLFLFFLFLCFSFLFTQEISYGHGAESDTPFGLILLSAYLMADGFTSTFQEKLFKGYTMSTYNQMLYVNASSAVLSVVALLFNGTFFSAFAFAARYPAMLRDAVLLSLCASLGILHFFVFIFSEFDLIDSLTFFSLILFFTSLGQMVIYHTIKNFGALIYSTIMTTRQFVSLLLSSILFLHPISGLQWLGVIFVFFALYYEGELLVLLFNVQRARVSDFWGTNQQAS